MAVIELSGKRFGMLQVEKQVSKPDHIVGRQAYWQCRCDCGKQVIVRSSGLLHGKTISCGCQKKNDLVGEKFGRLLVISKAYYRNGTYWNCICDCGNQHTVYGGKLTTGHTKSCGCYHDECNIISDYEKVVSTVLSSYKTNAKVRGIEFNLLKKEFEEIIFQNCYYCNSPPDKTIKRPKETQRIPIYYSGVDRLDNNLGYSIENSVPCCTKCNKMKLTYSIKEFSEHIEKLYNNFIKH